MKALVSRKAGGTEELVLEEVPEPVVGPGVSAMKSTLIVQAFSWT